MMRCGLSVACVMTAVAGGLACRYYGIARMEVPLLELAIVIATWYAGLGPSVIAVVLSAVCHNYFFTYPLYSFDISSAELPRYLLLTVWAIVIAFFLTTRRRIESELHHALDRLHNEIEQSQHRENEIQRLNEELARRADELMASNKELEAFAYSVSHDLRAPLRHVAGYSELLQKQASSSLGDKSRRYIQTILDSANRMGNLIDDLLAFSRIGRAETRKTLVSLGQLVREVVAEITEETTGRDIAWQIHSLPACYGDRSMLRMVVVNLIANAVKFTSIRTRAEIEIGYVDTNESEVEVFVKDNGAGFDMRYAHKLFGVFQRLHLPEQYEGTGIGLAIVQRIIVRHGGRVRAEGAADQGATFYFSLPKLQEARAMTASMP